MCFKYVLQSHAFTCGYVCPRPLLECSTVYDESYQATCMWLTFNTEALLICTAVGWVLLCPIQTWSWVQISQPNPLRCRHWPNPTHTTGTNSITPNTCCYNAINRETVFTSLKNCSISMAQISVLTLSLWFSQKQFKIDHDNSCSVNLTAGLAVRIQSFLCPLL